MKVSKSIIFLVKSFLGNFYRHLAIFFWSHWFCSSLIWLVIGMSCGFPPMQKGGSLISRMRCSSLFWKQKLGSAHFISFSSKSNGVPQNVIIELYGKKRKGEWRRYFLGLVNCHANLRINVWSNNRLILLTLKKINHWRHLLVNFCNGQDRGGGSAILFIQMFTTCIVCENFNPRWLLPRCLSSFNNTILLF